LKCERYGKQNLILADTVNIKREVAVR